jgi:ABC-type sugar transport system ATPase subunit
MQIGLHRGTCIIRAGEKRELFKEASFHVEAGKTVALLGPSGSGKTTLLRVLTGLLPLNSGQVSLRGRFADGVPPEQRRIAMLFQHPPIISDRNAVDNAVLGNGPNWRSAHFRARVIDLAGQLGLTSELLSKPMRLLSGGERQRAALVRALSSPHDIVLLDEPIKSSLSLGMRPHIVRVIREALENPLDGGLPRTAIVVTHDIDEAASLAQEILVFNGKSLVQGKPAALYRSPPSLDVANSLGSLLAIPTALLEQPNASPLHLDGRAIAQDSLRAAKFAGAWATAFHVLDGTHFRIAGIRQMVDSGKVLVELTSGSLNLLGIPVPLSRSPRVGNTVGLHVSTEDVFLFDDTGQRIP